MHKSRFHEHPTHWLICAQVEKHETVQGIDYLRQRAVTLAEDHAGRATALSLKGFLKGYFPLIKPSELAECLDVCLARRGIGPFAKKGTADINLE